MPIPILYTIPNFITAGSGGAMLNIIERLDRDRFAPTVCVSQKGGRLDQQVEALGIPFLEAPFTVEAKPYAGLLGRARAAAGCFRPYRFQLWHSFHYSSDYSEAIIARLSGAQAWIYTKKNMNWGRRAWYLRSLFATRIAAQNTDMLAKFFNTPMFKYKTHLIPRGVDIQRFRPDVAPTLSLRQHLGIDRQSPIVACVAHLVPVKGHPTLFQAIAKIPTVNLLLAGKPLDQEYQRSLLVQVRALNLEPRVHFLGEITDIPALLAEADMFVLPTWGRWRMEGCPVALLEAMACGKACIATDIPGARDLIQPGQSGLIVPPEDADAIATAIRRLIQDLDLRGRLGRAARDRVERHFTIEKEVARHTVMYAQLLGQDG